jgi:hypothetical protein
MWPAGALSAQSSEPGNGHAVVGPHGQNHRPVRYFDSSPEVIRLVVMMYIKYPLSLRNVEDLLFVRGIDICHETVRLWWNRFGPMFAAERLGGTANLNYAEAGLQWEIAFSPADTNSAADGASQTEAP